MCDNFLTKEQNNLQRRHQAVISRSSRGENRQQWRVPIIHNRSPTIYDWFSNFYFYFYFYTLWDDTYALCIYMPISFVSKFSSCFMVCRVIMSALDRCWEGKWDVLALKFEYHEAEAEGLRLISVQTATQILISKRESSIIS